MMTKGLKCCPRIRPAWPHQCRAQEDSDALHFCQCRDIMVVTPLPSSVCTDNKPDQVPTQILQPSGICEAAALFSDFSDVKGYRRSVHGQPSGSGGSISYQLGGVYQLSATLLREGPYARMVQYLQ